MNLRITRLSALVEELLGAAKEAAQGMAYLAVHLIFAVIDLAPIWLCGVLLWFFLERGHIA